MLNGRGGTLSGGGGGGGAGQLQPTVYSTNLAMYIRVETVDYYGQKRSEGGDPVNVLITDPSGRQQSLVSPHQVSDLKNGVYVCKLLPTLVGKHYAFFSLL